MKALTLTRSTYASPQLENLTRHQVRRRLSIPSPFFFDRGFTREVLDQFDVGHVPDYRRVIVPCYQDGKCVGCTMRSINPMCDECGTHHRPGRECRCGEGKWTITRGFPKRSFLYNLDAARKSDSPIIFLVEGPPDVWRFSEARQIAVAVLGNYVLDGQLDKLRSLDKQIVVALDNDEAGREGWDRLQRNLITPRNPTGFPRFTFPEWYKDPGDIPVEELRQLIDAFLEDFVLA
jgi:hypothetical protein